MPVLRPRPSRPSRPLPSFKSSSLLVNIAALALAVQLPPAAADAAPEGDKGEVGEVSGAPASAQLGLPVGVVKTGARVWKQFIRSPRNGVDLLVDCIRVYPDADQVLGSLANETGLPVHRVGEALAPLALNLLLNYTKIFAVARSDAKLRKYLPHMASFYRDKNIDEEEYTKLNAVIDRHVRKKLTGRFTEKQLGMPLVVLEAVKKGIFQRNAANAV